MGKRRILSILVAMTIALPGWADDLIPATSDDITDFDKKVIEDINSDIKGKSLEHRKDHVTKSDDSKNKDKKERKQNFGLIVSTEAHRLNEESGDKKKQMGKWVSEQRRQSSSSATNGVGSNSSGGSVGNSGSSMSADAKNAAPGLNGSNGSTNGTSSGKGNGRSNSDKK